MPAFASLSPHASARMQWRSRDWALGDLLLGQGLQEPLKEDLALLQGFAEVHCFRVGNLHTQIREVRGQNLAQESGFLCCQNQLYHTSTPSWPGIVSSDRASTG